MIEMLRKFWQWCGMTPEEFAINDIDLFSDYAPFNYDDLGELYDYCKTVINQDEVSNEEIDNVLTIMALTNENETVLDILTDSLPNKYLTRFIELGIRHMQPHARWQIAELIYRRRPDNYDEYLKVLANDEDSYVKKRANNVIRYIAEESIKYQQ